jgi:hypothetical protein
MTAGADVQGAKQMLDQSWSRQRGDDALGPGDSLVDFTFLRVAGLSFTGAWRSRFRR